MFRKLIIAAACAMVLLPCTVKPSSALPAPVVAGGTAVSAMAYVTGGFIGVVGVICVYDLIQKINGQKHWDGSPVKAKKK
jgi:hypothetical protein